MKNETLPQPPPLTDKTKPWGVCTFTHSDGTRRKFYSVVNEMSGNRLSAFDSNPPDIDEPMAWVKTVFRNIHRKAKDVKYNGTIKFPK